jgi:hypothetical protein
LVTFSYSLFFLKAQRSASLYAYSLFFLKAQRSAFAVCLLPFLLLDQGNGKAVFDTLAVRMSLGE